jgi:hypothetical protein
MAAGLPALLSVRRADAIRPVWADLWHLYRVVRRERPRIVLELGSGCSTVIVGEALRRNGAGRLYSLETDVQWFAATARLLGGLPVELCNAVAQPIERYGLLGFEHRPMPVSGADLLYVDGPALTPERQITFDPLDVAWRVMVIDGRLATVEFLRERLSASVRSSSLGYTTFRR